MNQVGSNEKLSSSVAQRAHGVSIPNFLIQCFSHGKIPCFSGGGGRCTDFSSKASIVGEMSDGFFDFFVLISGVDLNPVTWSEVDEPLEETPTRARRKSEVSEEKSIELK